MSPLPKTPTPNLWDLKSPKDQLIQPPELVKVAWTPRKLLRAHLSLTQNGKKMPFSLRNPKKSSRSLAQGPSQHLATFYPPLTSRVLKTPDFFLILQQPLPRVSEGHSSTLTS